ncbi:hypothetical protein Hanom_Chr06g00577641 [Helianthus anomalus]
MPCRTLGTYGACTRRSRSLWAMDRECLLNTYDILYINTYVGFYFNASATLNYVGLINTFRIDG